MIQSAAVEVRCGKPGRAPTGQFSPRAESYVVGSIVRYYCEPPFLIAKPASRICQTDGTWSGAIPLCYNKSQVQQLLQSSTFQEKTAAKAVDSDPMTCFSTAWEKDGYWSAILPYPSVVAAVRIDFPVDEPVNVEVSVKTEDSVVFCTLNGNYNGQTKTKIFYCPENTRGLIVHVRDQGSDNHFFEICEVDIFTRPENTCMIPDVPANGFGNLLISGLVREYTYFCNAGYDLFGEPKSSCQPSGTWIPKAPVCHRIQCVLPRNFGNGSVHIDQDVEDGLIPYNGAVEYYCNPGFILQGTQRRFCIGWNRWSGEETVCITKQCGIITSRVANGKLVANSTAVHSVALLVCNDGYLPLSDDRIECLPEGEWSHASLICAPIRCDPNPVVPHGSFRLLANSTFYGSRLQVTCDPGYTAKDNGLRMCESDGKWEDLSDICIAEITCDLVPEEIPERGTWHLLNDSFRSNERPIRVLKCHLGYHIVGTPPIIRCRENGSWSFSVATCMKTPQAVVSTDDWTPNAMLAVAVAAGAGTAVCILCLVASFVRIRKRRHLRTTTTVFHVGMANAPTFTSTLKGIPMPPEEHYYTTAMYEDIPESQGFEVPKSRTLSKIDGYEQPKPRKPSAGLPLLPLDTDPVYAQPFETGSTASLADHKLRKGGFGSKDDPYSGHVYAEPIDSRRPPSGSSTVSGCIAETWFRGGTTVKMTRKMSLPDCQQSPKAGSNSVPKSKEVDRTCSTTFLCPEYTEKEQSRESTEHKSSDSNGSLGLFDELQNNSIYLAADDQDLQRRPVSSGYKMADNDIYLDDYFSSA